MRGARRSGRATIPSVRPIPTGHRSRAPRLALLWVLVALLLPAVAACGGTTSAAAPSVPAGSGTAALAPAQPVSGLPTMTVAALPPQGVDTLRLIAAGGPFPYAKDGATFSNREGLLPAHPSGWYQEYTVVTPGSPDRGARRIVAGRDGGKFYSDDHYASFHEIVSGVSG
ncbi:MAG: hypothetical protein GC157_08905 [Frankiales bacterium]|nr:hypothetical protein [Frankiales bacterium]